MRDQLSVSPEPEREAFSRRLANTGNECDTLMHGRVLQSAKRYSSLGSMGALGSAEA